MHTATFLVPCSLATARDPLLHPARVRVQSCKAVIAKQIGPPPWREALQPVPSQKKIHWLHLPKCGSSFGAVLYAVVCQRDPSPDVSPYTGEKCDYCGKAAPLGPRWDQVCMRAQARPCGSVDEASHDSVHAWAQHWAAT